MLFRESCTEGTPEPIRKRRTCLPAMNPMRTGAGCMQAEK